MPYIEILLARLTITKEQENALKVGAIDVLDWLAHEQGESILVFVDESQGSSVESDGPQVSVRLQASLQNISARDRARITWGMIDMLQRVLGRDVAVNYEVIIEETASFADAEPATTHAPVKRGIDPDADAARDPKQRTSPSSPSHRRSRF